MRFVTADDVRQADGPMVVGPGDRLTPLARDLAAELGVEIRQHGSVVRRPSSGGGPTILPVQLRDHSAPSASAGLALPPSGAMYRRHTPLNAGVDRRVAARPETPPRTGTGRPRVGVIGAGHVGAMTALRLAECNLFSEVAMVDIAPGLAAGLALDIWHGSALGRFDTRLVGTDDPAILAGASYIVVTAGRPRQPGMTRTDLTDVNAAVMRSVGASIAANAPDAVVVVVTNPLEEMTHTMAEVTGFDDDRVIGMAGVLDTVRFCSLIGLTGVAAPSDVAALAMGSHGPEMVIPLSQATVRGRPVEEVMEASALDAIVERTRDSGAEVVGLLKTGSAYFAPAESAAAMVRAMAGDSGEVVTACVRSRGAYGLGDSWLGLPVRLGPAGLKEIVTLDLRPDELRSLHEAGDRIADRIRALDQTSAGP